MSWLRKHIRLLAVAGSCVALGAGASAIASAGAASSAGSASAASPGGSAAAASGTGGVHKRERRTLLARAVHGQLVVATRTGFATLTLDRGLVQSVSSQQLTLLEGTKKATYKTVTLTIPVSARVRVNRQLSTLSAVKPGMRASVLQTPKLTRVVARVVR